MRGQQTPLEVPLTDASRARGKHSGAGAVLGALYCHYVFTAHEVAHLTIMDLEGLAAVLWVKYLCEHHADLLRGRRFVGLCDNEPFVAAVNKRGSNYPQIAYLIGILHKLQCQIGFDFTLQYIPSKENIAADALSRGRLQEYFDHMSDTYNLTPAQLTEVPVDQETRSSISSAMIRGKL